MYEGQTVGVVIPAYNEAGFVGEVIETLPAFVDRAYVVDDCSTDETWAEIDRVAARVNERASPERAAKPTIHADGGRPFEPPVVAIRHERNRGVGGAIKTGYERARADALDVVAVMNGDGQMDPDILDRIIEPVVDGRAEFAKGNRLSNPDHREQMPAWRVFGNGLLTFLTKCVSGYWRMNDPQNGYTAISRRALDRIDLDRLYEGYGFCNDLLVHLNVHGMRIEDVAMSARYGDERSHIRYRSFVPTLSWLLARRAVWRYKQKYVLTDFHPLVFLAVMGVGGGALGMAFVGWSVATAGVGSLEALVSILIVLLAGLFVTLAMVFDRLANESIDASVAGRPGGEGP